MPEVIKNTEQSEELGTTTWTYWLSLRGMWVIGGELFRTRRPRSGRGSDDV